MPPTTLLDCLHELATADRGPVPLIARSHCNIEVHLFNSVFLSLRTKAPFLDAGSAPAYRTLAAPVRAPRPMKIQILRRTTTTEIPKGPSNSVEALTGDAGFDDAVHLDTLSAPEVVRAVLADDRARSAVLELLDHECWLTIDDEDGDVVVHPSNTAAAAAMDRALRIVSALDALVGALPPIAPTGHKNGDLSRRALLVGGIAAIVALPATFIASLTNNDDGHPLWPGAVAGILVFPIVAVLARRRLRPRSDLDDIRSYAILVPAALCVELGLLVARLYWWLF